MKEKRKLSKSDLLWVASLYFTNKESEIINSKKYENFYRISTKERLKEFYSVRDKIMANFGLN